MPNQIPVLNYIFGIIEDADFWISMSKDHLVMINEMLKDHEENVGEDIFQQLNDIYDMYCENETQLDNIRNYMLNGEQQYQFYYYIGLNAQKSLQDVSSIQITNINYLARLEKMDFSSMTLLLINHTMMEEKYVLELLSANMNKITGLGFRA